MSIILGALVFLTATLSLTEIVNAGSIRDPGPWTTSGTGNLKEYILTGDPKTGGYEFDVKGLDNSSWSGVTKDVYTLASVFDGKQIDNAGNTYHISVWLFGPNWFPDYHGKYRLRINMNNLSGDDNDPHAYEQDTRTFNWDPNTTYHVKVEWDNHEVSLYIDGKEEQGWDYTHIGEEFLPAQTVFRIGSMHWGSGPGLTYSNIHAWIGETKEPVCGDGILDPGEECDDGNTTSGDGCSATCQCESTCGNGYVECDEQCDDGNTTSGDGCSASCTFETPDAPSNLTATAASSNQINLNWADNSDTEDGFKIERGNGTNPSSWSQVGTAGRNATSYSNTGLSSNTTYSYRVRSYNAGGDSTYSNTATATTHQGSAPPLGATLTLVEHNYAWPSENWDNAIDNDVDDWDGTVTADDNPPYAIFAFSDNSVKTISEVRLITNTGVGYENRWVTQFTVQVSTTDTSSFNTVLNRVTKHGGEWESYTVSPAVNARYIKLILDQPSAGWRQIGEFKVYASDYVAPTVPPNAPGNLSVSSISHNSVNLRWNDNSDNEEGFKIERAPDNNGSPGIFVQISQVNSNVVTYGDTGLDSNTTYHYRLKAFNVAGDSGNSNIVKVTTINPADPPSTPILGISGDLFTINGSPTFLLGVSVFDAVNWNESQMESDLQYLQDTGYNLIRVWADWSWQDNLENQHSSWTNRNSTVYNLDASLNAFIDLLKRVIEQAGAHGMVVDVTIEDTNPWFYGNGDTGNFNERLTAAENITNALKGYTNVLFDICNEHDHDGTDFYPITHSQTRQIADRVRATDSNRIVTVSSTGKHIINQSGVLQEQNIREEVNDVGVAVMTPHFYRSSDWSQATTSRVTNLKDFLRNNLNKNIPVYLQEENYYSEGDSSQTFIDAAVNAKNAGAAGWTFHQTAGFDLKNSKSLREQLGSGGRSTLEAISEAVITRTIPFAPSNLTAIAVSKNQIEMRWQDNSNNEEGFYIYRSTTNTKPSPVYHTNLANDTVFTDGDSVDETPLDCDSTYYYWVEAFNSQGTSSATSNSFTTASCGGSTYPEDLNQDGTVNVIDVQLCVNVFLGTETTPDIIARADVNDDGSVNVIDVQRIVNVFLGG